MNTGTTWQMRSTNSAATEQLAEQLGQKLKGGEVIELVSDIGGGKTTFVRGLARGAGSQDHVASPTFTVSKIYKTPSLEIHHFDFYRLHEPGAISYELAEVMGDPKVVVVIEWSDIVKDVLPKERLSIVFRTIDENNRQLTFTYPKTSAYLIKGTES